jgi:superfamily II DNA/RNA helicase
MEFIDFHLSQELLKAIKDCRFSQATKVQEEVIPAILQGKDVVVKAKTGSGKTSAFAIPIIEAIDTLITQPKVLIITPTRELAVQVCDEVSKLGVHKEIKSIAVYGKQSIQGQIEKLNEGLHIIVGTPGRIKDLISRQAIQASHINCLVLDEADELVNRGFFQDIIDIMNHLAKERQTLLFSATMPPEIQDLCQTYLDQPHWVEVIEAGPKIKEIHYYVEDKWKFLRLRDIIETIKPFNCIIFCNTQANVDNLYNRMRQVGMKPSRLHGGMKQAQRLKTINSFREGNIQYLLATDLVARGIHIDSLDLVVNYDVPQIPEIYVHRIGRTGRVGEEGMAVSLFTPSDDFYKEELEKYLASKIIFTELGSLEIGQPQLHLSNSEKRLIKYNPSKKDI